MTLIDSSLPSIQPQSSPEKRAFGAHTSQDESEDCDLQTSSPNERKSKVQKKSWPFLFKREDAQDKDDKVRSMKTSISVSLEPKLKIFSLGFTEVSHNFGWPSWRRWHPTWRGSSPIHPSELPAWTLLRISDLYDTSAEMTSIQRSLWFHNMLLKKSPLSLYFKYINTEF